MIKTIRFIQKYSIQLKYGLLILSFILMIFAIRAYLNNIAILDAIQGVKKEQQLKIKEINFTENFLLKYLGSEYADYFLSHENNVLYKNEYILRLDMKLKEDNQQLAKQEQTDINIPTQDGSTIIDPKQSRKDFLSKKIKAIK